MIPYYMWRGLMVKPGRSASMMAARDWRTATGRAIYYWLEHVDLVSQLNGPVMTMRAPHRIFLPIVLR